MSTPQATIYICSGVRLDNRYEHSIYFADATAQQEYFAGKVVKSFPAYSYLRKSWPLQVEATLEQARKWSYLYFRNGTGKFYYYFITQVEYKNDNMVELTLELDVLQTYLFDWNLLDCFVERQHNPTDEIGENIIDEGLELGELVTIESEDVPFGQLSLLMQATIDPEKSAKTVDGKNPEQPVKRLGKNYNGIYNGCLVYACNPADHLVLSAVLYDLDNFGFSDGITALWMYPDVLLEKKENDDHEYLKEVTGSKPLFQYYARPETLSGGYVPKNNKMFCYPYNQLYVTNNSGTSGSFRYELFGDPTSCGFKTVGAVSPEGNVILYPLNYAGEQHAYEHGVTLNGFPNCSWNSDTYKLWLAQNQNQQNLSLAVSGLSIAGGIIGAVATGGTGAMLGLGSAVSGAQNIASILAQRKDMQLQPPQAKGNNSPGVNTVAGFQTFTVKKKTVDAQHARIIDNYFTMYGYKLNRVQKPNIHARPAFTYVKTVGCKIAGNMCTEDITKIESIFDRGLTFWTNGNKIGDYSQDNKP